MDEVGKPSSSSTTIVIIVVIVVLVLFGVAVIVIIIIKKKSKLVGEVILFSEYKVEKAKKKGIIFQCKIWDFLY